MTQPGTIDVEKRAQSALASSPIYALRELRVQKTGGDNLLLIGHVHTFYHKQLAQEVVRAVANGCQVINSIDVD